MDALHCGTARRAATRADALYCGAKNARRRQATWRPQARLGVAAPVRGMRAEGAGGWNAAESGAVPLAAALAAPARALRWAALPYHGITTLPSATFAAKATGLAARGMRFGWVGANKDGAAAPFCRDGRLRVTRRRRISLPFPATISQADRRKTRRGGDNVAAAALRLPFLCSAATGTCAASPLLRSEHNASCLYLSTRHLRLSFAGEDSNMAAERYSPGWADACARADARGGQVGGYPAACQRTLCRCAAAHTPYRPSVRVRLQAEEPRFARLSRALLLQSACAG